MDDSCDIDRAFNPFKIRSGAQANISFDSPLPLNRVIYLFFLSNYLNYCSMYCAYILHNSIF